MSATWFWRARCSCGFEARVPMASETARWVKPDVFCGNNLCPIGSMLEPHPWTSEETARLTHHRKDGPGCIKVTKRTLRRAR